MKASIVVVISLAGAALSLAACGTTASTSSSVAATATPSPVATATPEPSPSGPPTPPANAPAALTPPIADATATRDALLQLATGSSLDTHGTFAGFLIAWEPYASTLNFSGYVVAASSTSVSGGSFVLSKTKNVNYTAIAVMDSAGHCAGGVVESADQSTVSKVVPVDGVTDCKGSGVATAAGY